MSRHVDAILDLLSDEGQTSPESGYPESSLADGMCWHCTTNAAAEGAETCDPCRAFLLGDTEVDPRTAIQWDGFTEWDGWADWGNAWNVARQAADRWAAALYDVTFELNTFYAWSPTGPQFDRQRPPSGRAQPRAERPPIRPAVLDEVGALFDLEIDEPEAAVHAHRAAEVEPETLIVDPLAYLGSKVS